MKVGRTIALVVPLVLTAAFLLSARITLSQSTYLVRGQVVDESGGLVAESSVRLYSAQVVRDLVADGDGQFEFKNLPKGTYELEASEKGFETATVDFEIAEKSPEPLSIKLRIGSYSQCGPLYQGVRVTYEMRSGKVDMAGVARDKFGFRRPDVRVKLVNKGTSQETISNDMGEFTFSGLEPGKYSLQSTPTPGDISPAPPGFGSPARISPRWLSHSLTGVMSAVGNHVPDRNFRWKALGNYGTKAFLVCQSLQLNTAILPLSRVRFKSTQCNGS